VKRYKIQTWKTSTKSYIGLNYGMELEVLRRCAI